jgi:hypothetical protein
MKQALIHYFSCLPRIADSLMHAAQGRLSGVRNSQRHPWLPSTEKRSPGLRHYINQGTCARLREGERESLRADWSFLAPSLKLRSMWICLDIEMKANVFFVLLSSDVP